MKLTDLEASGLVPLETPPSLLANIARVQNEVSIHARTDPLTTPRPAGEGEGIVDRYYGHVYARWLLEERLAPYGLVDDLFPYEIDRLANHDFLRIPFRRIPRRVVRDQDELAAIVALLGSVNPDIHVAFRGQNREYLLPRRPEGRDALYGDPRALEPSLLPSGARAGISFEETLPEWFAVVNLSMHEARRHVMDVASAEHVAMMQDEHERLGTSFRLYLHGMAIAQHYGLPSTGLDLTDSIATAVGQWLMAVKERLERGRLADFMSGLYWVIGA